MDRISNLPADVVFHIVSFLSAKDAARTRTVSKNFKNLITIIPDLAFRSDLAFRYDLRSINNERSFKLFSDQVLAQPVSHRIRRFSLHLDDFFTDLECLCYVLNRGILDLCLHFSGEFSLPLELFTCKTVVKMKLEYNLVIDHLPENASLPALKTLCLNFVWFDSIVGCVFTRLLSACPVLEDLVINDFLVVPWNWSRIVSSLTLKRLAISGDFQRYDVETISFDTPSLTYFNYSDLVASGYPVVNLNSLVEACLKLVVPEGYPVVNIDPTNLIKGLKNVHFLTLESSETVQVFEDFSEAVPVFENMSHLSVVSERDECLDGLKVLVKKSPNLKTLTIEELHYEEEDMEDVCECLLGYSILSSLEVLKIARFGGGIGEMVQIKHILEKLPCLELLEVRLLIVGKQDKKKIKRKIKRELLKLPRASSKCKVVFLDKNKN